MNNKIGIFDSGIGGVTVLKEILKVLPKEDYIYYSDSKNNPYGDKNDKEILKNCDNIVKYFLERNCKCIVIACNTASAKAAEYLRNKYKHVPIIAIEPAYKMVYDYSYNNETLIMATKGTIESEKFNLLLEKYNNNKTQIIKCSGLADVIEEGNELKINQYLQENIYKYKGKVKNVVLGCTHYPLIKEEIRKVLGEVEFFEGAKKLAIHLEEVLKQKDLIEEGSGNIEFIDSKQSKQKEERFFETLYKDEILI